MATRQQVFWALQDVKDLRDGDRFQRIVRQLLMRGPYPNLNPLPTQNDLGQDATAELLLSDTTSVPVTIAISLTASWTKLDHDCSRCIDEGHDIRRFVFVTWGRITGKKRKQWAQRILSRYKWDLQVMDREWIMDELMRPGNSDLLRNELAILGAPAGERARLEKEISRRPGGMDHSTLLSLTREIKNPDSQTWTTSVEVLRTCDDPQVVNWLVERATKGQREYRWRYTYALGRLGKRSSIPVLTKLLKAKDSRIRHWAVTALGECGDTSCIEHLLPLLGSQDIDIQSRAVLALGRIGGNEVVEPLVATLGDARLLDVVRSSSAVALSLVDEAEPMHQFETILSEGFNEREVRSYRWAVTYALGRMGGPAAERLLMKCASDGDRQVRWLACAGLSDVGTESAIEVLADALSDPYGEMQRQAAYAMGCIGGEEAEANLRLALERCTDPLTADWIYASLLRTEVRETESPPRIDFPPQASVIPDNPLIVRGGSDHPGIEVKIDIHTDQDWPQDRGVASWSGNRWALDECYFGGKYHFAFHYVFATEMEDIGVLRRGEVLAFRSADMSEWMSHTERY